MYTECCHAICERGENVKLDMCTVNTIIVTVCKFKMPKHEPITHVSPKKKPHPYIMELCISQKWRMQRSSFTCICRAWFEPRMWHAQWWRKISDTLIMRQEYNNVKKQNNNNNPTTSISSKSLAHKPLLKWQDRSGLLAAPFPSS